MKRTGTLLWDARSSEVDIESLPKMTKEELARVAGGEDYTYLREKTTGPGGAVIIDVTGPYSGDPPETIST